MVFIDGSNLYHALKSETSSTAIDLYSFGQKLAGSNELHTIYYYNATLPHTHDPDRYKRQQQFFARVQRTPRVIMRLGHCRTRGGVLVEKGVDVLIAVDMLIHASRGNYDVAVLVSGDGDLVPAVQAVTELGRIVINAAFPSSRSDALVNVCHEFIAIDDAYMSDCRPV